MSFDIFGYKPKAGESEGEFLNRYKTSDNFTGEEFSAADLEKVDQVLIREDYTKYAGERGSSYEYDLLQISVYHNYIFMTVPYWDSAAASIDEAVNISVMLYKETGIYFYDPQIGQLITGTTDDAMRTFNSTIETMKKILPDNENS